MNRTLGNLVLLLVGLGLFLPLVLGGGASTPPETPDPGSALREINPWDLGPWKQAVIVGGGLAFLFAGAAAGGWWLLRIGQGRPGLFPPTEAGPDECIEQSGVRPSDLAAMLGIVLAGLALPAWVTSGLPEPLTRADALLAGSFSYFGAEILAAAYGLWLLRGEGGSWRGLGASCRRALSRGLRGMVAWFAFLPVYAALVLVATLVLHIVLQRLGMDPPAGEPVLVILEAARDRPLALAGLLAFMAVGAPVVEEVLFRGFLYGVQRRWLPVVPAAILNGLIFGAVHGTVIKFVVISALGILLCLLRERSGSLAAPIAAHLVNNAAATALIIVFFLL